MARKYYLAALSVCISLLLFLLFLVGILKTSFFETKIVVAISLLVVSLIIFSFYAYFSKNVKVYNVGVFLSFLLNIVLLYNIIDLNMKYDYIMDIFKNENEYITYNVYVQRKTTMYDNITKLDGRKIGVLNTNANDIEKTMGNLINGEFLYYEDILEIENAIYGGEIQCFVLTDEEYQDSVNVENSILQKVRTIYSDKFKESH